MMPEVKRDIILPRGKLHSIKKYGDIPGRIVQHLLLIGIGFVFVYPILLMLAESTKDTYDLINPLVQWIPTKIYVSNFIKAWTVLGGFKTLLISSGYMLMVAAAQTLSSALIGYGFAKFNFRFKNVVFLLMIATFIIPDQVTFMPRYLTFKAYGMLRTIMPFFVPALLGQGIKSAIFILIFFQFFRMSPKALDEAAQIDGAGVFRVFTRINLPSAVPAIIVVFIFSFVWHWNETYLADLYFETSIRTFPLALEKFTEYYAKMFPVTDATNPLMRLNEGVRMAGTLLCIAPLLLLYALVEGKLVESIDRSGITGE
ncbi:carbohydrate ABC transporter permease [Clostridium thermosuccinogenes]|uniref:carbohydrate ABC transporter permease n=1 Tax=Clostridium thermosuccinogenes TaxID=84032 RepID=UPI000CCC9E03|nr:carbohydrate ABC transporter permease [Pseudoclostridium thermosuccinogenes]PNT91083.1 hypothetical protein CDQ83_14780 [Pseudoclostridium thermosuccinogenes]